MKKLRLKICHVSRTLCPRMVKLAWCQRVAGDRVFWVGESKSYQQTVPFEWVDFAEPERFGGMVPALRLAEDKADLFHVHTHITDTRILETVRKTVRKPVVWDAHDRPMEGMTVPADLGPNETLGRVTYRPYCPKGWFAPAKAPTFNGLVIATGLSDAPGHFRYWREVFSALHAAEIPVRCYTFSDVSQTDYAAFADIRPAIDVRQLIVEMSEAVAGLCGSPHPDDNMRRAQPNKLWEYVAAGIPAICLGPEHEMAGDIERYHLGVVVESADEIVKLFYQLRDAELWRQCVQTDRFNFTMESQVGAVREVYENALKAMDLEFVFEATPEFLQQFEECQEAIDEERKRRAKAGPIN